LILNLFFILLFTFESVQAQNLPFYNKSEKDSIKIDKEKEDLNDKGNIVLLQVPERYKSHPEYGKTKLRNPDRQNSYELIQERTVDSRLFQNTDGSFTSVKSGGPLHYKDSDGWWRTIDVTFKEDTIKPNLFHLNNQKLPMSFDGISSVVTMQLDSLNSMSYDNDLSFIQIDNNGNMLSNKSINNVVATVDLNKPKASVNNIFDGIDMSFAFDSWMTKTNYVISSRSLINNNAEWVIFRQKVNVPENWVLEYDKENGTLTDGTFHGDVLIKNTNGKTLSKFQMPVYFDSGHNRNTNNITGSYKIEKINNSTYYLYLMVPATWLLSSERVYPVTLDPTVPNDDPTIIASCLNSYQASNLSVGVSAGYLITNSYLLWEFTAVNNGAYMQDQQSYVSGTGGSTSVFYGSGTMAGMQQYAVNSTIGNGTSTGLVNFTFYALRVWGGSACDNLYNYLNRRYIEVTYIPSGCNNYNNLNSNVNGTGYAPCGSFAVTSTIGQGEHQNHFAYLGSSYTINTCGTSWDTQITGFQGGSAILYYNDDNALCTANTLNSWVDWTSPVNGWVQIQVTKYTSGGCLAWAAGATSAILRVMENPPATPGTPTLTPAGGTYCAGAYVYIDAIGSPPTGVTWYWQTTPSGTSTLNGGPTYVVNTTGTYYLRPRSSSGCWGTASGGVTTTFYPGVSNNNISANQTICAGTSPSTIIGSSPGGGLGAGTYSYGWEISTDGGFTWSYAPAPNTGINYSPTALYTTTFYKRYVLSGPCNASASNIVVITVQPVIDPGSISADQNICYNTTPAGLTGSPPSGGTGSYAYQWQQQPGCSGGWSDISGATAFSYNFPGNLTQTTCYRRLISSGVCPSPVSNTVTISVYSDLAPGSVFSSQVICYNSVPSAFSEGSAPSGGTGSYSYQWQLQTGCSGGWADISGANSNTLSYGSVLFQTTCFRRRVISGACNPVYSNTITVAVYGDVTPGTIASNQSICFNTAPSTLTNIALASGGDGSYSYQWQQQSLCSGGWGDIGGATSINYTSAVNLFQTTCFRRRVINACGTVFSNVITVTVYVQFTGGSVGSDQNIPYNTAPTAFTNLSLPTGGTGAVSYQWQQQPGCSGAWSDIGGAIATTYIYPGNLTQNTCFQRIATNACGSVISNTITVSVQGPVTSGTIGSDQIICFNTAPSQFANIVSPTGGSGSYTYQWQIQPGCSGAWSDIPGATGNVYSSTLLAQNTCFRRVATSSGQSAISNVITVTVYAILTSGSVGSDQVLCYNNAPSTFIQISAPSGGTGGYTYQWQSQPGCSGGWGDISGATASTYQAGNLIQTTCYRRNVTSGTCGTVTSNTITISVNADLTSGSVGSDQFLCFNTSPAAFTQTLAPSGGTGSYTYQWLIQPGCTGFYNFIPGATSPTYAEPSNLTQTTCYRRTVTSGSCGQATTNTITVTVYADLTSGSVAANQIICFNTTPAQFTSAGNAGGGTGSYSYQWQIQPGCSGGWSDISGATSNIYMHTALIQTTCFRRNVTSGSCGTVSSNTITVTVYANLSSGSVAADQILCYNTSPAAFIQTVASSGGTGSYTYQWQSQPGCSGGWGDISGATATTYDEPANLTQTTCYRRNVTSGSCGTISSNTITVTVYANLTPGSAGSDQTLCNNSSPAAFTQIAPSGGTGTYNYQWQIQPGCSGGWSDISGATAATYDDPFNLTQTTCYRRNVTSGSCGTVSTNIITVTVYDNLTSGSIASDQTICFNTIAAAFTNTASPSGGTGSYAYQWQIQPGCSGAWSDIPGAINNIYSPAALTLTTCFRRNVTSGSCGTVSSNTLTITVYDNLTSGSVGSDQTICYNTSPTPFTQAVAASGGNLSYTYQWQSQPGCSGGWGDIAGATAPTYDVPGNIIQTTCYKRNVTSGSCGTVSTNTITVTVYANLTSGSVGNDQFLCYNTSPAAFVQMVAASGGNGIYTYQWQIQPGCTGGWSDISGATATTYDEPGNLVLTTCYRRNVTSGSCGTVSTNIITVTVYGDLNGGTVASSQTICFNQNITGFTNVVSPSGGNGFYNYQWQIQPGCSGAWSDISGATSNIYSHPSVLFQTTCFRRQITNPCGIVYSNIITITVNPLPIVSFTGLAGPYCISQTTPVPLTGSPSGGTFSGNGITGDFFIPYYAAVGNNTITYTYTDGNVCTNNTSQNVTVIGLPTVDFTGLAGPYCVNNSNPIALTGYPAGGTFSGAGISGNSFIPSLAGVGVHTITYTYSDANGCTNNKSYTAVVNALPAVTFSGLQVNYCINASPSALIGFPSGGTFSGAGISGNIFNPTTAGPGPHIITYTYADAIGCINSTQQTTTVHNLPGVSFSGLNATYCLEASSALLTGSPSGGTFSGNGISGNYFYPIIAGQGTFNITYTYTDGFSCLNSSTQSTTVYGQLTPGIVGNNQTICYNTSPAPLVNVIASAGGAPGTTYQWQQQPGCIGSWSNIAGATAATCNFGGNLIQTTCFRRLTFNLCGSVISNTIEVYVYADLTSGSVATDQTICYNTSPAAFTQTIAPTGGNGTYTYQWQIQPGCSGGWSDISGATATTYDDPGNISLTTCYRRKVVSGASCGTVYTNIITVTVFANLTPGSIAADQTICYNTTPVPFTNTTSPTGGTGIYSYQWQIQPGCTGAWSDIPGGISDVYAQTTPLIQTSCFRRRVISGSCGTVYSNTVTVTVFADLTSGAVAADQTICYNTSPAAFYQTTAPTGGNGSYTYQWQQQPLCSGGWGDIIGATASTYDVLGNIIQTTCYRNQVTSGLCGTVITNTITVTVYADLTSGAVASDQTICYNTSPAAFIETIAATGGNNSYTYQWQEQPGCSGIWSDIAGATATTYDVPGNLTQTTCYRRRVVSGASCGTVYTNTITVTVFGNLTPGSIATDQTICYNTMPVTFTNTLSPGGGTGSYAYQWQIQPGCSGAWSDISGANSDVYSQSTPLIQTTCYIRRVTSGSCGTVFSNFITVTVYADLTSGAIAADQTICYNTSPAPFTQTTAATGGNGTYTYQWQEQTLCTGNWSAIAGGTASTYDVTGNITQTTCYKRLVTSGTCGTLSSNIITETVYPDLTPGTVGYDQSICFDSIAQPFLNIALATGGSGIYTYQWQIQPGCSGAWSDITGATSTTYAHPSSLILTTCFRRVVINTCGTLISNTITVNVFSYTPVSFTGLLTQYCTDALPALLTGTPSGGTFSGAGITGNYFYPNIAGSGLHNITYTYIDPNGCMNFQIQQVNVYDIPIVSFTGLLSSYCVDAPFATLTGTPAGGTFSGTGITGNTFNPSLAGPGTYTITYSYIDAHTCTNSSSQTVTVHALPQVGILGLSFSYCVDNPPVNLIGLPFAGTFSGAGMTGNIFTPASAGVGTHSITYTYTDIYGCTNFSTLTTHVYGLPVVSFTGLQSPYCTYSAPETLTGNPSGGTFSGPGIVGDVFYPNIPGIGTFNIVYSYTDGNSCLNHDTQTVVVYAQPIVYFNGLNSAYCIDAPSDTLTGTPPGGTFSGPGISGDIFDPSAAGAGTFTITYNYISPNGCYGNSTQTVIVHPLPVVFFSGLSAAYCVDAPLSVLNGSPAGGYFTGPGMMGNIFDPSTSGPGTHTIIYHYSDGNSCYNTYSQTVIVNALPIVTFTGLSPHYCPYEVGLLQGIPSGGTFTGPGMVYNLFYASISGVGTQQIVYTFIDGNNCLNTDTQTTVVSALVPVNIIGLATDYCVNNPPAVLTGSPSGGTFTGPGMTGNTFYPDSAGVGIHTINYASTDSLGCINDISENVVVHGLPIVDFYGLDSASCVDALPSLLTGIPAGGTFSGSGINGNYFYPNLTGIGTHTITYSYTDNFTCVNHRSRVIIVNPLPIVNITNLQPSYCYNNPPIALSGTPAGGTFSGTGVFGGYFYPLVSGVGTFNVTYTFADSNSCVNFQTLPVVILPVPLITSTDTVFTCSGQSVNYNITSSLAGTTYIWTSSLILGSATGYNSGSGGIIDDTLINNTLSAALVKYVITPTSSSTPACTGDPFVLIVNVRPYPTLYAGHDAQICSNTPYTVIDATTDPLNIINWTTNGLGTFNNPALMHTTYIPSLLESGNISLYMTVTNLLGCSKTDTMVLVIDFAPIANAGGNQIINCGGLGTTLGSLFHPNYVYNWSPVTGLSNPNIAQPTANPLTNTTYILTVTDTINGCFDVDTTVITLNGAPYAFAGTDTSINCGGIGLMIGSTLVNNMNYNWSPALGLDNPNISQPFATPLSNTTYTVTVTDSGTGCYNTDDITITVIGAPTANAGPDQSVNCGNIAGIVIGSPGINGMHYSWQPTTGLNNPNIAQPIAHPMANTTYVLTVTDTITGCFATDAMSITVIGAPSANAGFDQSISCGSGTGALIGTPAISGLSYNWLPSNGLSDPNIAQPTATPLTTTTYHLIVTDMATGCYATDEVVITSVGIPVANAGLNQSMNCGGAGLQIGSPGIAGMLYNWSPSNSLSDPNIAQPTATPLGNTTYTLTVTDSLTGCYNTDNITITVIGAPIAAAGLDQSVNCGSGTTIGTLSVPGMSYTWIPSLGLNNPNIAQPIAAPHTNTIYTLIVTNTSGCYATDDVHITVIGAPLTDAGVNKTINCGGPGTVIGTPSVTGMSYTWAPAYALSVTNIAQPTATPLGNTTYYLTVTDLSSGCYGVDSVIINVAGAPVANAGVDQTISCGGTGTTIGTPGLPVYSYTWTPPNGLSNPNSPTPLATPLGNTTYLLTVTDTATGCFGTDVVNITVSGTPVANAGLNQAISCGGPGVLIGPANTISGVVYTWNPSYGLNNANIANPIATPYNTTNYVLTATDTVTGCYATDNVLVTVVGIPTVYAGSDGFVCANDTFMISNATSSNSFVHWTYDGIGNLTHNTTLSPTYFPLPNEFGTVIITLTAVCNTDTATDNMTLTIYPYPVATFSALDSSYCIDNPGNLLVGYPSGGTFTGAGITGDFFSPAAAGVGPHLITYTYQDPNGCVKDTSLPTIVNPLPIVSFTGLASHYCAYDAAYLIGTPSGGTFTGAGMVDNMFYASISGVGTFSITYSYLDNNGCLNLQTQQTIVTAIPSVNFTGLASQYCVDAPPVTLTGIPASGTFTGPGITGNIFNPSIAGPGTHTIDYSFNDTSGCISNATQSVIVYALPVVVFSNLDTAYCIDATPVVLNGFPAGGTFTGPGISDSIFNPSVAGSGIHTITYTYTDNHGCINFYALNVKINPLPIVTLSPLNDVCIDLTPFPLYGGLPSGGIYSGTGVVNNIFYPALAGVGTHPITYTYTDYLNCTDFAIKPIIVNPLPVVSFTGLATYYCIGNDSVVLTGTPTGGIFSGPGITGNTFNPITAGVGFHNITYTFTDSNSCTGFQTQQVEVKALPIVNFSGLDTAYCIDAPVALLIGYPSSGTFTGAGISGTTFTPSVAGAGIHVITYTYMDTYLCIDSSSQNVIVHALPIVTLAPLSDVCTNYPAFALTGGSPLGGIYTGAGITANVFYPDVAGAGPHIITYTFTDIYGCVNFATQTIIVNPLPVLTLNGLASQYCFNAPLDSLSGLPAGGYFIGPGISGNAFNPSVAGVGTHNIGYVYTNGLSCTDTLYQSVTVLPLPQLAFSGLDTAYCVNNPPDSLYGFPIGGYFFGPGITPDSFDPSLAGVGTHFISYTYTDGNVCSDTLSKSVVVHALPVVTFGSLAPLCIDALPITLNTGLPLSGTYSGPGVSNGQFNPTIAGAGTHTLTYAYSDINGCVNSATQTITVNPLPVVSITGLAPYYCANAIGDTIAGLPVGGTFSGTGMNSNIFEPFVAGVGTHLITYTYTDSNSCTNHFSQNTDVKPLPQLTISGLDTSYCINSSPVYITGMPAGGTFSGPGISGNIFDPVVAGVGIYGIVYTYTDFYGCTNIDTTVVIVNALSILSIIPVNPVCIDAAPFLLQCILPAGGTYSGEGVVNGNFYPQTAGAGAHTIYYDYIDNNNCMISASTVITVNPLPVVALNLPLFEMCSNDSLLQLTGGTPTGGIYSGTGISGSVFNPFLAGAGVHIITYTYTDSNTCVNSAQAFINVNQAPLADAGQDVSICAKTSVTLTGTGGDFYVWSTNETTPEIVVSPVETKTYYVTVNDAFNGCSEVDSVTVTIIPLPVVVLVTDAESSVLTYGQYITFTTVPSNYNYYDFYMNTALAQTGPLSYYSASMITSDTMITVIALDGNCISEPFSLKLNVKPISNAFTPNGDGKNDVFMKGYDLTIMNRWGQSLYEGYDGWDGTFNGTEMPEGTYYYIIRFKDSEGNTSVSKGSVTLYRTKQ